MNTSIFDLIRFIVWHATQTQGGLTTLSLVKYLYLADLYNAEETGGKTVTGFPWIFYHYGPYCTESFLAIEDAVSHGIINAKNYESQYEQGEEYQWYSSTDQNEPKLDIPDYAWLLLSSDIARFKNIRDLMDYVYFETTPMQHAKERALLDFSVAKKMKPEVPVVMNKLSAKKIKKVQEMLNKIRQTRTKNSVEPYAGPQPIYDESYYEFAKTLDDECEAPKLKGKLLFFD
jgi:hypothetical protein